MNPLRVDRPATLIPFPTPVERAQRTRRNTNAEVIDLAMYRRALETDRGHDAWDRLVDLARAAWTWRDPESIEALESRIGQLKASVHTEWEAL